MSYIEADFIVVGSGIAGLSVALSLADTGSVIVITKADIEESNSYRAQGGIAAAIGDGDSPTLHQEDTLRTGVDLCDPNSVAVLVKQAPQTIQRLVEWGTPFDHRGGKWLLGKEGAHSASRILHVNGDATGKGITLSLKAKLLKQPQIELHTYVDVCDLIVEQGVCYGLLAENQAGDRLVYTANKGVVLASGGCGQLFRYTTNDTVATGDGFAMAFRAGAQIADMEFIQFHPTAFHQEQNPMFLISEAVRGEGAIIINEHGDAIMERYHPWKDLAPRDVVSRAIYQEQMDGSKVYLDATMLKQIFAKRFPTIDAEVRRHGFNPEQDPLPVTPAAHFIMGGIRTNRYGETSVSRLFACGEVACTGVHGANRLASNSLLEGAVFAQEVAKRITQLPTLDIDVKQLSIPDGQANETSSLDDWQHRLQQIMWSYAGIIRTKKGLETGRKDLASLIPIGKRSQNMWITAQLIIESAWCRTESRGGHFRSDFPEVQDIWDKKHIVIGV